MEVEVRLLPGTGKSRIHWFCRDPKGPIRTRSKKHRMGNAPAVILGGAVGFIACQPELKSLQPQLSGNLVRVMKHSDDARAVTCPECMAHPRYKEMMAILAPAADTAVVHVEG